MGNGDKKAISPPTYSQMKRTNEPPLERFVQFHRNAFVSMQACTQHTSYQLLNKYSRVRYTLDAIENNDASLRASLSNTEDDTTPNGKREDFEKEATHMLPKDPILNRRTVTINRTAVYICNSTVSQTGNEGGKQGIGATGVHLRYYKPEEYFTLNGRQKGELNKWREENGHVGKNKTNKKQKATRSRGGKALLWLRRMRHPRTMSPQMKRALKRKFCPCSMPKLRERLLSLHAYLLPLFHLHLHLHLHQHHLKSQTPSFIRF